MIYSFAVTCIKCKRNYAQFLKKMSPFQKPPLNCKTKKQNKS